MLHFSFRKMTQKKYLYDSRPKGHSFFSPGGGGELSFAKGVYLEIFFGL